ncbi:MAG: hypothetical protein R3288_08990 [Woeseiaceae bacterium]|nr:hypothetical protein [Woeseiaceae bacterium]
MAAGIGAVLAGAAAVIATPVPAWLKVAGTAAWCAGAGAELVRQWQCFRRVRAYCLHADGSIVVFGPQRSVSNGRFAAGSVLAGRLAWLVVESPDGRRWGELVGANSRNFKAWRRFRVIFRHVAAC